MRYRGHVDALRNWIADGWAVDMQTPDHAVTVELLIDGQLVAEAAAERKRPDLKEARIGTGQYGFMIAVPESAFDGRVHAIGVRIKGTKHLLVGNHDRVRLDAGQRPVFEGAVTGVEQGILLRGYARNAGTDAEPVIVDLLLDGTAIAHAIASGASPDRAPPNCGFAFNLAAAWRPELLTGRLECRVAGTDIVFPTAAAIGRAIAKEQVRLSDGFVEGSVRLPAFVPPHTEIELRLNDERLDAVSWQSMPTEYGNSLRKFLVRLSPERMAMPLFLEIGLAGYRIGGGARKLVRRSSENLVANGLFSVWEGSLPKDWSVADPAVSRVVPEHCLLDLADAEMPVFGPLAVRFELQASSDAPAAPFESGDGGRIVLLSQALPAHDLSPGDDMEWALVARSRHPVDAAVTLVLKSGDGETAEIRSRLRLGPRWSSQRGTLVLPFVDGAFVTAAFCIELSAADGVIHLAAVGLGIKDFKLASAEPAQLPETIEAGTPAAANAVVNGLFESWSRGLVFSADARTMQTADGWFYYSEIAQPAVKISAERLLTRDPSQPGAARRVYGLSLDGELQAPFRLEAELDPLSLRAGKPDRLRFYVCRANNAAATSISRILLVRRRTQVATEAGDSAGFIDDTICIIARNVAVGVTGRHHEFRLPGLDRSGFDPFTARGATGLQDARFLLLFEFENALDCVLAEVALGQAPKAFGDGQDFIGVEDPNVANQLDLIKGVEAWAKPQPIGPAPVSRSAAASGAKVQWRLPHPDFPSVEIVIPVFNAREETIGCLQSIERNSSVPYLLTLVDDASDAPTATMLAEFASTRPWVRRIRNDVNLGYTRSSNLGMAQSAARWVLLLNSDTVVPPRWLEGLFECALSDPGIKFVGALSNAASWQSVPDLFDANGKFKINALPDGWSVDDFAALVERESARAFPRVALLNGFCTLMERQAIESLGYLDEVAFPVGYGEENDLCLRAGKAGHALAIADQVYVYHVKSASFGKERRDGLSQQGMQQLILKHPDVDLKRAQEHLRDLPSLVELRRGLAARIAGHQASVPAK